MVKHIQLNTLFGKLSLYGFSIDTEKTLQELDHVIGYYNVAGQVESVVKERPSSIGVPQYLQAMDRLAETCKYFEQNKPESVEIENVVEYHLKQLIYRCIIMYGFT